MSKAADSLHGKVVVITGAASGIGAATAVELHRRGALLVLVDCDAEPLAQIASKCGRDALSYVADVTSMEAMDAMVASALARFGRIDIVWANAGVAAFGPLAYTDPGAWRRCVDVNVFGVFNTVRAALPAVQAQRGYVAISASVSSFAHPPCHVRLCSEQGGGGSHGQFMAPRTALAWGRSGRYPCWLGEYSAGDGRRPAPGIRPTARDHAWPDEQGDFAGNRGPRNCRWNDLPGAKDLGSRLVADTVRLAFAAAHPCL